MLRVRTIRSLAITVLAVATSARAAVVTYSNDAPTLGVDGIKNIAAGTSNATNVSEAFAANGVSHYVAGDNAAKGQTFTTGANAAGYTLTSLTLRAVGYAADEYTYYNLDGVGGSNNTGGTYTVRFLRFSDSTETPLTNPSSTLLRTETATAATGAYGSTGSTGGFAGPGTYVTFTFATPLTLLPNTSYGFDVGSDGTFGNGGEFFETSGTSNAAAFAGGAAYITGASGVANPDGIAVSTGDRVFFANVTAVPEPTSIAVLAGVGLLALRRRRA